MNKKDTTKCMRVKESGAMTKDDNFNKCVNAQVSFASYPLSGNAKPP